jgi:hypothetical protein
MGGYRRELSKLKTQCVPQCNARTATFSRAARVQRFEVFPADADYGDRIAQRCAPYSAQLWDRDHSLQPGYGLQPIH